LTVAEPPVEKGGGVPAGTGSACIGDALRDAATETTDTAGAAAGWATPATGTAAARGTTSRAAASFSLLARATASASARLSTATAFDATGPAGVRFEGSAGTTASSGATWALVLSGRGAAG